MRGILKFALALAPFCLAAQGPVGIFPWWEGQISSDLNLSDGQRQQVEGIQREYRAKMIDGRADVAKAELTLDDAMNAEPFDLRRATDAANKVADARHELTKNLSQMGLRMRAVLTKEQWEKARARFPRGGPGFDRGGDRRPGGGPGRRPGRGQGGGPGGPPPGPQF
jgi:Spy/CpxP family protein refolding chaperone